MFRRCSLELGVAQDYLYWQGLHNMSFQEQEQLLKYRALFWRAIPSSLSISFLIFLFFFSEAV